MKRLSTKTIFDNDSLTVDLERKSIRGGVTTLTAQFIKFALSIVGTAVLARILTPHDYGLIAMVAVVVNFATLFKDAGLSMATVHRERISHEQISSLFWINLIITICLGAAILLSATVPWWAPFA